MSLDSLLHSEPDELLRKAASELRQHLETGQDCHAETVLNAFPSLASDPHRALELIVLEFRFRRELGQNPDPRDWYERFPHWSEQLRERLEELPSSAPGTSQQETAALGTSPYWDANPRTVLEVGLDAPVLGRHEILEEIGRGGMGVVYRARDLVLARMVALKVIRTGSLASAAEVRCFYREARSAARLRNPYIVPIYGMGLHEGQHCFTMPLFPRGSLSRYVADYRNDLRSAVGLAAKVARAVQSAHDQGIIHRDLKPGNILLDERGEPVVSDFGLAKQLDVSATQTMAEHPIGTPAYMAPEQARCEVATKASDIWSLGVILYELLTGRRPFSADSPDAVKQRVLQADPVSPRRLRPDLPRELETIVLKCLVKEPARRYASAAELADELERWLSGEPIRARPESRWQRLRRRMRAKRSVPTWLLIALLLLSAGVIGAWSLFTFLSPEARERRRQEQVLASLQGELAEGGGVTLVGPLGPPKWYRWRTEKGRAPLPVLQKEPFELDSVQGPLLLDLLSDPQIVRYRFSAEVQAMGERPSQIGLFFAAEELATPAGIEQCFGLFRLKFENLRATAAELRLIGFMERDVREQSPTSDIVPYKVGSGKPPSFIPPPVPAKEGSPWRRVELQITPEEVRAFCDGAPMGDFVLAEARKRLPRQWQKAHPPFSPLPAYSLRGSLGLYVLAGPANFRNVVVEPLPQP